MKNQAILLFLFLLPFAHAESSTGEHELAQFSAVRFQDESFSSSIFSQATLRLSANSRLLTAGAANDLPADAYICPGQITPMAESSFSFARNNDFSARGPKPGNQDVPRQWQGNEETSGNIQLGNSVFSGLLDNHDAKFVSENTDPSSAEVDSPARQDFLYMRQLGDPNPQSGASYAGVSCTGNAELQVGGQAAQSINFAGGQAGFQPINAQAGDYSLRVRSNILDCAGIIQPLNANLNGVFANRKYIYYTDAGDYRQSTDYTPAITIHVRNPQVSASGAITRINNQAPPQVLQMQRGTEAPIEIQITNAQAGAPRRLRVISVSTSNNALSFSANGLPGAYIVSGASGTITGTLAANSAFNGQVQLIINTEADGIVCDGSIPRPQVSLPLTVQITEPPQAYPDLQISQVSLSSQSPAIGGDLRFTVVIRNSGDANAVASIACLNITKADGSRLQTIRQNANAIAQDGQAQISFSYNPVQGPAGGNSYSIIADCDNQVNEGENEGNNRAQGNFEAVAGRDERPNIHALELSLPESPQSGTQIQISVRLENNGGADIEAQFDTCLVLTAPSGRQLRRENPLNSLEIDAPATISFRDIPINEAGEYSVIASADCNNDIEESNENAADNSISGQFTSVSPQELPNLAAEILPTDDEDYICEEESVHVRFRVLNTGQAETDRLFSSRLSITAPDDSVAFRDFAQVLLAPQGSREFFMNYRVSGPGEYAVSAAADIGNSILESDEGDNTDSSEFAVQENLPNLRIAGLSYEPEMDISTDTRLLITVIVENNGCARIAPQAEITLDSDIRNRPPALLSDARSYSGGLEIGESHEFFSIPFQLNPGFFGRNLVRAVADGANAIREIDEGDNEERLFVMAVQGQGGGRDSFCYIASPASPLYSARDPLLASVQFVNYQPIGGEAEFDCGNGDSATLSCRNDESGGAECTSDSACTYDEEGTYTARAGSGEISCTAEIEVGMDDFSTCSKYI